ncbi:MAG TPA: twin-arginine translocation signal domain-containing protein, partial [Thermodesulfobacteriota bacterium]|nr:twin-arginine translocation signal domain-containing protein [Thermodesulfobacteriota bacterium]HVP78069.1 twin-arginine translocation signal domain-containing protein [Thermodesulfobacteriota bacterium]
MKKKSGGLGRRGKEQKKMALDRRTFLKLSALTGAAVGAGKILGSLDTYASEPLVPKTPGALEQKWLASSCLNCQARCAIRVRVVGGKAVRITGNRLSKVSDGKICPRG